jgi:hypothetical protein
VRRAFKRTVDIEYRLVTWVDKGAHEEPLTGR